MSIDRKKITEMALEFKKICQENDIWFALDNQTMLGAVRHGGYVPWEIRFEVMMKVEDFVKIKRLFPKNIIDSSIDNKYRKLTAAFVKDASDWQREQPFIKIRVATPTTIKMIKKYQSSLGFVKRFLKRRKDNVKMAINDLFERNRYEGYFLPITRKSPIHNSWIQVLSGKVIDVDFLGHKFPMIKEYDQVLSVWFGKDYMTNTKVPNKLYQYPYPTLIEREQ